MRKDKKPVWKVEACSKHQHLVEENRIQFPSERAVRNKRPDSHLVGSNKTGIPVRTDGAMGR